MKFALNIHKKYKAILDYRETENAIQLIKDFFQKKLADALNLHRITAPLFVKTGTGINDDLNGVERPVSFQIGNMNNTKAEIVQSLAKWKRLALADLKIPAGEGIYTDMNAIRPDETLSNIHSLYVDQWDWERVISKRERNIEFLQKIVRLIYLVIRQTEAYIFAHYAPIKTILPEEIAFIHAEDLLAKYPKLSCQERENAVAKEYGAVFIIGIGGPLQDGQPHDGRAPDYDDWTTPNPRGKGLNGDIIIWYPVLSRALELSSMGIRVDEEGLLRQLKLTGKSERQKLYFHKKLLAGELPLSIGGGIGQSRLCLFYLRKAHIGEVQASLWPDEMVRRCRENNIHLY